MQTICAFANDFENNGGGYLLVGVEQDEKGVAKRPVKGIPIETLDGIQKKLVEYETNEERTYFLLSIPCREGFENEVINDMSGGVNGGVSGGVILTEREKHT